LATLPTAWPILASSFSLPADTRLDISSSFFWVAARSWALVLALSWAK